jgi:hypothetical protein
MKLMVALLTVEKHQVSACEPSYVCVAVSVCLVFPHNL